MKKIFVVFVVLIMFGCAGQQVSQVCPPPEGTESWLCDKSAEIGITLETTYGWIYTGTATGVILNKIDRQWVCDFDKEVADWYLQNYPISYDDVILEVVKRADLVDDPMKVGLLKNIINSNLQLYSSPSLIGAYDDRLIRDGNNRFRSELYCEPIN